jgi:hypothetical protein
MKTRFRRVAQGTKRAESVFRLALPNLSRLPTACLLRGQGLLAVRDVNSEAERPPSVHFSLRGACCSSNFSRIERPFLHSLIAAS